VAVVGIGIDLVKVDRIRNLVLRWQDRFLNRLFTEEERRECFRRAAPYPSLAARFAAKEAVLKALGTGWSEGIRWMDIQVVNDASGKPVVQVAGRVETLIRQAAASRIHLSLAHDGDYAMAEAVLTRECCVTGDA
jgi:holo-[acyl-carrier protein] synthase